jgi:hypothetical protein
LLTLAVKPQLVRYKLDEIIERPYSDLLVIYQRKCIFGKVGDFLVADG